MTNGRQKGSRGERDVAHIIKEWWRKHEGACEFIRTPLSGGWAHDSKAAAHFKASGDLMTTAKDFPFCVEVKWREGWSVSYLLDGKATPAWEWWRQAIAAAKRQDDIPMMWLRKNRIHGRREPFPWLVWIPEELADRCVLDRPDIRWDVRTLKLNSVDYGGILPVAYDFQRFTVMDPVRFIGKGRGGEIDAISRGAIPHLKKRRTANA